MTMLAEVVDAVIGGDTHRDTHSLELTAPSGVPISRLEIGNDPDGYRSAIGWALTQAPGSRLVFGLEGTRSYGAGLARALAGAGFAVVEVERPRRAERRRGKSDPGDAHLASLAVLRMDAGRLPTPRSDGPREALRILLGAREQLTGNRTAQVNTLRALLLTGTDADRAWLATHRGLTDTDLQALLRRRPASQQADAVVRHAETRRLARDIRRATRELTANKTQLSALVDQLAPGLRGRTGIGPVSAAQAIVSWSHHGRCRNDAAYAALGGACPIPASSGQTVRHRLNRGGDRALNRALHQIALTRMRVDERTRAYTARRRAEGKTDREIRRCLKRYIARELYRALQATPMLDNT